MTAEERLRARVEELEAALARIERMACSEHDADDCGPECGPAVARAALQSKEKP